MKKKSNSYQKEISDWKKNSKARAETSRRALIKGLKAGDKTE